MWWVNKCNQSFFFPGIALRAVALRQPHQLVLSHNTLSHFFPSYFLFHSFIFTLPLSIVTHITYSFWHVYFHTFTFTLSHVHLHTFSFTLSDFPSDTFTITLSFSHFRSHIFPSTIKLNDQIALIDCSRFHFHTFTFIFSCSYFYNFSSFTENDCIALPVALRVNLITCFLSIQWKVSALHSKKSYIKYIESRFNKLASS